MKQISINLLAYKIREKKGKRTLLELEQITGINSNTIDCLEKSKYILSAPHLTILLAKLDICHC